MSFVLQEVDVSAVSEKICYRKYLKRFPTLDTANNFPGGFMVQTKLCVGTKLGGKGACKVSQGSSTGPVRQPAALRSLVFVTL